MPSMAVAFIWGCAAAFGGILVLEASELSERYNEWTTRLRQQEPGVSPPPTPPQLARNTKIFAWLLRVVGGLIVLASTLSLIEMFRSS